MSVHESDVKINEKLIELQKAEQIIRVYSNRVRILSRSIGQLFMIATTTTNQDGTHKVTYTLPNNIAGDTMDEDYRKSQQDAIIINVDKILKELDVLIK